MHWDTILFDLDGTIINSYPHFVEFFYEVCKKNGVPVPYGRETVYRMLKITVPQAYARLNCEDKMSYEKFYSDFVELYTQNYQKLTGFEETIALIRKAKEAGKIGHIGLTGHSLEIFDMALEQDWVEVFMFPYNIVETQAEEQIRRCKEKNIGFVVMKPLAGGAIEDATLAMRFICANPNVTVVIPGMYDVKEIDQNVAAVEDTSPLTEEELAKIQEIRQRLGNNFCRRCNYCAPCTVGINIPGVFLMQGYLDRYGLGEWATDRYMAMGAKAGDCVECGACEPRCPYNLPIREMLKDAAQKFGC